MLRHAAALCILTLCFHHPVDAADGEPAACQHCNWDVTTLRLYFPPDVVSSGRNPNGFKPEIAKLYVDDLYVGDSIVNLHDYIPSFRFPKSSLKIRIEMSENRKFETKLTFLGAGSRQILYVDFPKAKAASDTVNAPVTHADASTVQPFEN